MDNNQIKLPYINTRSYKSVNIVDNIIDDSTRLINKRLNKLKEERDRINAYRANLNYGNFDSLYSQYNTRRNMSNINPNFYANQYIEQPSSYRQNNIPVKGIPMTMPKVGMGEGLHRMPERNNENREQSKAMIALLTKMAL